MVPSGRMGWTGPGLALGPERQIDIFQCRQCLGRVDLALEWIGQELSFRQRFDDRLPPGIQLDELRQPVADTGDLHLIQQAGGLLAVAGDKRHGPPPRPAERPSRQPAPA